VLKKKDSRRGFKRERGWHQVSTERNSEKREHELEKRGPNKSIKTKMRGKEDPESLRFARSEDKTWERKKHPPRRSEGKSQRINRDLGTTAKSNAVSKKTTSQRLNASYE